MELNGLIETLSDILKLPNLDDETIRLVNVKLREAIGKLEDVKIETTPQRPPDIDETLFYEWTQGLAKRGEGVANGT